MVGEKPAHVDRYRHVVRLLSYMAPGFPHSLFETVADLIDADVSFDETRSGPEPGFDPFRAGRAELGWVCSTSFVQLALSAADPSVQLVGVAWVPDDPGSGDQPVYFGDLTVPNGSTFSSLAELGGMRIGCNDPVSLSGHHALRIALVERGHDADTFAELVFTGGHQRSLELLAAGELDAAVVDSVVRRVRAASDPVVADLRVIDRLGPWPVQPLVASTAVGPEEVRRIRDRLLAANDDPRLQQELRRAGLRRFVSVGPDHYQLVGQALASVSGPSARSPVRRVL